eukprot:gene910-609_t
MRPTHFAYVQAMLTSVDILLDEADIGSAVYVGSPILYKCPAPK